MGNFYVNFTVKGASQQAVAGALAGRVAIVAPEQNGCVVAFDEESDHQDMEVVREVAAKLSGDLRRPVLAVLNHDDDILWIHLFLEGALADEYNSSPGYFDIDGGNEDLPAGGDAAKLCAAFGADDLVAVEKILRKSHLDDDGYTFEVERHAELAEALGLPAFSVGAGYGSVEDAELPEELAEGDLIYTS